ncbi:family 3 glycoside hydrolase [Thozetella sp. PMI_491]|nr:family 3 glycoside hydrolase [Thozetella sp. PMI_491]
MARLRSLIVLPVLATLLQAQQFVNRSPGPQVVLGQQDGTRELDKKIFIDRLVNNMSVADLEQTMHLAPSSPIGAIHDVYTLNRTQNDLIQRASFDKARIQVPLIHFGECLHGVGSFKQSMFPQAIGLSATFDTDLVYRVARAIGTEARSIGIHACFSPVLDLGLELRWGRVQEAWGEDKVLTSHMGVAYSSGLSKNGSWADPDAVVPVIKHFGAHGAPQAGINAAPFSGRGVRQIYQDVLTPFKAAIELGGARGVMTAYNEFDDVPAAVHPILYKSLREWGFDGIVIADDTGMQQLETRHHVAGSPADAIHQWFEAGGMIQFYDYSLDTYLNATKELVSNGTLALETLRARVRSVLSVKWDLGLFRQPYIDENVDPLKIVESHVDLTVEAARKSIVLLKNENATLPLQPAAQGIKKVALIGPFADTLNYGDYSGAWGEAPAGSSSTIRQAMLGYRETQGGWDLVSSWGANTFEYNSQHVIPPSLLSANGRSGGLLATYYADTEFKDARAQRFEAPVIDWGLFPPPGLASNNFSAVWEGELQAPVDADVDGWVGLGIGPNTTARLFVDGQLVADQDYSLHGTIMSNIMPFAYIEANSTLAPKGGVPFTFRKGVSYHIRIEYRAFNTHKKIENESSLNSQLLLFWNLVSRHGDAVSQATEIARSADVIVLAVGANWNSDGESGDRATLDLAPSQTTLAESIFALGKPVVLVLEGGRPFAIPEFYDASAAVISASFPGQSGGQAIADVLFGAFNPGGRLPLSVPRHVGQLPVHYNYKPTAHAVSYVDIDWKPYYPFGYGLSYTTFSTSQLDASVQRSAPGSTNLASHTFSDGDLITFSVKVTNTGAQAGSFVAQIYLLGRVSSIVQPVKQLVAFTRVYLEVGEERDVTLELEVDRYLSILNREYRWELERGAYTFALLKHGGVDADKSVNITLTAV